MIRLGRFKNHSVLPGFGLTLGVTVLYLSLIVLIPLSALFLKTASTTWGQFWGAVTNQRAIASYRLTFFTSAVGASINGIFGFVVAWTLVRYRFPGQRILDAAVDLPFALPTAVSGIALTALYAKTGWIGRWFDLWGIQTAFSPLGVAIAQTFIGLPFVVRTLQPAIQDCESRKTLVNPLGTMDGFLWNTALFLGVKCSGPDFAVLGSS